MNAPKLLVLLFVMVIALPVNAQMPNENRGLSFAVSRPNHRRKRRVVHPILALLAKPVRDITWDGAPLSDVVEWLRTMAQNDVNIVVRWRALKDEGIDRDTEVTLELRHTTVAEVLRIVFELTTEAAPLTYQGRGSVLTISTETDFDRKMYTRVYDITEIVTRIPNHSSAPQIHLEEATGGGAGGSAGQPAVQPMFGASEGNDDNDDTGETEEERAERIMALIRSTVEPWTWDTGGGRGTVVLYDRQLVVRNSIRVHEILGGRFRFGE